MAVARMTRPIRIVPNRAARDETAASVAWAGGSRRPASRPRRGPAVASRPACSLEGRSVAGLSMRRPSTRCRRRDRRDVGAGAAGSLRGDRQGERPAGEAGAPATWFQQFEHVARSHSGHVRMSSPARPSWSRCAPHASQNIASSMPRLATDPPSGSSRPQGPPSDTVRSGVADGTHPNGVETTGRRSVVSTHHPVPVTPAAARLTLDGGGRTLARRAPRCHLWSPVSDPSPGWTFRPVRPSPRSIVDLVRAGLLDAGLAATLWRLVEGRVPLVVVADADASIRTTLLRGAPRHAPAGLRRAELRGDEETFDWLPQATELGWSGARFGPKEPSFARTIRSSSQPSYRTGSRRSPGPNGHGSRCEPRRSDTASRRRCPATRSRTSWRRSAARR